MYALRPEMAEELRKTNNPIHQKSPTFLKNANFIATIGDICTLKIFKEIREPNLSIVDMKTKRNIEIKPEQKKIMEAIGAKEIKVVNKPGTISLDLWNAIKIAIKDNINTKIIVKGEEDLAALAVISMAKMGAKVIYGMPDKGMVVVDVNQQEKKRANSFLKQMLVE